MYAFEILFYFVIFEIATRNGIEREREKEEEKNINNLY
jgi:hypothetical protein